MSLPDNYNWLTIEEYRKMSPEERQAAIKKELEDTKNMTLDDLYAALGSMPDEVWNK